MSLHSSIISRARANVYLAALTDGRIASESGIQGWALPYIVFEVGPQITEHTFGDDEDLTTARVDVNLYAASGTGLDLLENAWRSAFSRFRGESDGLNIKSWIESSYDEDVGSLETDTQARVHVRVNETMFAFIPTFPTSGIPVGTLVDFDPADYSTADYG